MAIKNIIFDFGGVLADWNPRYMYRKVFAQETEMEDFLTNICSSQWNAQQDAGRTWAEAITTLQQQYPEWKKEIAYYRSRWNEMLIGEIKVNTALLPQLKVNYNLYGLTNWSAETYPIAEKQFDFFQHFLGIVVSGREKLIKPNQAIYQLLLERYQLQAEECLFIDDSKANILAAQALGIHTIHLTKDTDLAKELRKKGIEF